MLRGNIHMELLQNIASLSRVTFALLNHPIVHREVVDLQAPLGPGTGVRRYQCSVRKSVVCTLLSLFLSSESDQRAER